jgi:dimethylhistidine N-methyltransferase
VRGPVRAGRLRFQDDHPPPSSLRDEVLRGLARRPRAIPPKFFYDAEGSRLFEAICELPEYYLTRTEIGILEAHADEMAALVGADSVLVELGSGSSRKVRLLLEAIRPAVWMPVDISRDHLLEAARNLAQDYPWLEVHAVCLDYSRSLSLPACRSGSRKVAFFPGSSIGNFRPEESVALLRTVREVVAPDGGLLIGVDLKKDPAVLHAAYNDVQAVTAAFNLNLLARINRELGADFDLQGFRHSALYNQRAGRIEMYLESVRPQTVTVDGERFHFAAGERIHTENSYKYDLGEFRDLARRAGFEPVQAWTDPGRLFSVHYLTAA